MNLDREIAITERRLKRARAIHDHVAARFLEQRLAALTANLLTEDRLVA